jgi:hypothetical protein
MLLKRRLLAAANIGGVRATRVEAAARGRLNQVGRLAGQGDQGVLFALDTGKRGQ